jgi:hypothetical protein
LAIVVGSAGRRVLVVFERREGLGNQDLIRAQGLRQPTAAEVPALPEVLRRGRLARGVALEVVEDPGPADRDVGRDRGVQGDAYELVELGLGVRGGGVEDGRIDRGRRLAPLIRELNQASGGDPDLNRGGKSQRAS